MHLILDWSAKRSGATMTVKGKRVTGDKVKITEVASIAATDAGVVATTTGGITYKLSLA